MRTFTGTTRFNHATFTDVIFYGATFEGDVQYHGSRSIGKEVAFTKSTFMGSLSMAKTHFETRVRFTGCSFQGSYATFLECRFDGGLALRSSRFEASTRFKRCDASPQLYFQDVTFNKGVDFVYPLQFNFRNVICTLPDANRCTLPDGYSLAFI